MENFEDESKRTIQEIIDLETGKSFWQMNF